MSYQPIEIETEDHAHPSNGWELETAVGASFTWGCDRMENAVEEQEGDLYFNQPPSILESDSDDVDPEIDANRDITLMQL